MTTTTISRNQFEFASERVRQAGLGDRITILSDDYRDLTGTYDKLVSIEMIEAVGHDFLDTFFRTCSERLKPTGRMLLQSIVIADRNYMQARNSVDFIQKYIFPGGALPSCGAILASVGRSADLQLTHLHDIGLDYARTLQIWRERFLQPPARRPSNWAIRMSSSACGSGTWPIAKAASWSAPSAPSRWHSTNRLAELEPARYTS